MAVKPLTPRQCRRRCNARRLGFRTTAELEAPEDFLGQARAIEALRFGIGMPGDGYHMFVLGPPGSGRHSLVRRLLGREAPGRAAPPDWVYVNNFEVPHRPRAIRLPTGLGATLQHDMHELVRELQSALPAAFESDDYRTQREAIDEEFKERQEAAFQRVQREAEARELAVLRTPMGFSVAPVRQREVISPEAFQRLSEAERKRAQADMEEVQERLQELVRELPDWEREHRKRLRELDREVARFAVSSLVRGVREKHAALAEFVAHLDAVEADVIEHVGVFLGRDGGANPMEAMLGAQAADARRSAAVRRYAVNAIVSGDPDDGAPVVIEDNPTQPNLIGRTEHMSQLGTLVTDFTLVKPGALHRANGGFLVIDALDLLRQPYAWEALKRALATKRIVIESLGEMLSLVSTISLEPEPIPLDLKVVLVGERRLYYLLSRHDPDFPELFKVGVDFEEDIERNADNERSFCRVVAGIASTQGTRALTRTGAARIVDHAARESGDAGKLSMRIGPIADLVRESDYWAGEAGRKSIVAADVERAIEAKIRRSDRIRGRMQEAIAEATVLIDTDGEQVGQINGLAVLGLGDFSFGRPSRITARVRMGNGEVVDIERRVELGGPLHSKGVMILSAFLGARFAADHPLSFAASLVFEQSYSGVDGDSASSTELYALLSALSELPIRQGLAVTGSVNQFGEVQAIGGVNEKVEGFFDVCAARGLSGAQGVLIPRSNVRHLMLRADVTEAIRDGAFRVFPVDHVDQGIELLTGRRAGKATRAGRWPADSVNDLVQKRLLALAHGRRDFARRAGNDDNDVGNGRNRK